jgi:ribosomal protein L32
MGTDHIAEVVCVYCGKVIGKKTVNVPESFNPGERIATHGICDDCILKLHSQLPETEEETEEKDEEC